MKLRVSLRTRSQGPRFRSTSERGTGAIVRSRACPRKGAVSSARARAREEERERVTRACGWPPGVSETFPNLFNLGTRRVSESYLREYEIKQSDKQTLFLQPPSPGLSLPPLPPPPPSSRERSPSWPGSGREVAPSAFRAL